MVLLIYCPEVHVIGALGSAQLIPSGQLSQELWSPEAWVPAAHSLHAVTTPPRS